MDRVKKLKLYELAGVKEYWIVDPKKKTVEIYLHNGETFLPKVVFNAVVVTSTVLEGFEIEASDIFAEPEWD
jgi:Uma2 family endonuclease